MIHRADDTEIDAIALSTAEGPTGTSRVVVDASIGDEAARRVIEAFLAVRDEWDDLWLLASCVAQRRSMSSDRRSVTFPGPRFGEPGRIYLADGTEEPVEIGADAALRLLARWLRTLVADAHDDVTSHEEWAAFVADVEAIERDAEAVPAPSSDHDSGGAADPGDSDMTWTTNRGDTT